jgi:Tfp pilus assembly protein PilN
MLKINLIGQRKSRKRADKGQQAILLGFTAVIGVAVAVAFLVHLPLQNQIAEQQRVNKELEDQNKKIKATTKDLAKLEATVKAAKEQEQAIVRLREARAVPAWLLWELSNILTRGRQPSVTTQMRERLETDPNRKWQDSWDPKHVWITRFEEKGGRFKLEGGAQADSDMTQLALRLQASMFFDDVQPEGGSEVKARDSGISYYNFVLSGKVRY